jgi:hypothetical protein
MLMGGNGSDLLAGDRGQDMLTGGGGNDTFILAGGLSASAILISADVITDLAMGDKIGLTDGIGFANLTFESVSLQLDGGASVASWAIKSGNNYLGIVQGVSESQLTAIVFVNCNGNRSEKFTYAAFKCAVVIGWVAPISNKLEGSNFVKPLCVEYNYNNDNQTRVRGRSADADSPTGSDYHY